MSSRKLVIFDWDGTIIDSAHKIICCMQAAAQELGLKAPASHAIQNIIGLGLAESIYALFSGIDEPLMLQIKNKYAEHFIAADHIPSPIFPGVEETLARLKAKGYLIAIATGKSRRGLSRVLDKLSWQQIFDASRCADETRSKPDPLMLYELLEELRIDFSNAVMVGDTEYDLEMAKQANLSAIAVAYGAHSVERLSTYNPLAVVDHFHEIEEVLSLWSKY